MWLIIMLKQYLTLFWPKLQRIFEPSFNHRTKPSANWRIVQGLTRREETIEQEGRTYKYPIIVLNLLYIVIA